MKKQLIVMIILFCFISTQAQKIRVQEPKVIGVLKKQDFLKGQKINTLIYDARILPDDTIDNFKRDSIIENLYKYLKNTFVDVEFNKLDDSFIYKKPLSNEIFLKIKITNFQVAFGGTKVSAGFVGSNGFIGMSGEWNALISYSVVLLDYRNDSKTFKIEIDEISSGSTMTTVGITTTNLMTKAYAKSVQSLVNFIETSLSSW